MHAMLFRYLFGFLMFLDISEVTFILNVFVDVPAKASLLLVGGSLIMVSYITCLVDEFY